MPPAMSTCSTCAYAEVSHSFGIRRVNWLYAEETCTTSRSCLIHDTLVEDGHSCECWIPRTRRPS